MNINDLNAVAAPFSLRDMQTDIKNLRKAQAFCRNCPPEIQAFLDPVIDLAADMLFDICDAMDLDADALEDTNIETFVLDPAGQPRTGRTWKHTSGPQNEATHE